MGPQGGRCCLLLLLWSYEEQHQGQEEVPWMQRQVPLSVWNRSSRTTVLCVCHTSNSVILQPPSVLLQQVTYVNSSEY